jgi:hypothetical protein
MNVDLAQELLNELGSSLQDLETQHAALLQFLKDNGMLTDEQFAPYVAQAGKASSVRWRAARVRLDSLISSEREKEEKREEDDKRKASAGGAPPSQNQGAEAETKNDAGSVNPGPWTEEAKIDGASGSRAVQATSENDKNQHDDGIGEEKKPKATSKAG